MKRSKVILLFICVFSFYLHCEEGMRKKQGRHCEGGSRTGEKKEEVKSDKSTNERRGKNKRTERLGENLTLERRMYGR